MKNKKIILAFAILAAAVVMAGVVLLVGGSGQVLKIAVSKEDLSPFTFFDENGQASGFETELLKKAAEKAGFEVKIVKISRGDGLKALQNGEADIFIGALSGGENQTAAYTEPYIKDGLVFISKDGMSSKEQLKDKSVAVLKDGAAYMTYGFDASFRDSIAEWTAYSSAEDMFTALENGSVDCVIAEKSFAEGKDFETADDGVTSEISAFLGKNSQKFSEKLQKALDALKADGTASELSLKWFKQDMVNR